MIPVFMTNDVGGIVHVEKNRLHVHFSGFKWANEVKVNTHELLMLLESKAVDPWKKAELQIEPTFHDPDDNALLVIITLVYSDVDTDIAVVFKCDLVDALKKIECSEKV